MRIKLRIKLLRAFWQVLCKFQSWKVISATTRSPQLSLINLKIVIPSIFSLLSMNSFSWASLATPTSLKSCNFISWAKIGEYLKVFFLAFLKIISNEWASKSIELFLHYNDKNFKYIPKFYNNDNNDIIMIAFNLLDIFARNLYGIFG